MELIERVRECYGQNDFFADRVRIVDDIVVTAKAAICFDDDASPSEFDCSVNRDDWGGK